MPTSNGSAAEPRGAPESAERSQYRQRLRSELPAALDQAERTLRLARQALAGPDPEAALEYLRLLAGRATSIRNRHRK